MKLASIFQIINKKPESLKEVDSITKNNKNRVIIQSSEQYLAQK